MRNPRGPRPGSAKSRRGVPQAALPEAATSIRRSLLAWFNRHRRDLPWRRTRDPYAIWLSEAMLQQTQVVTVIPYYERFLKAFPSVADLAAADQDDALRLWAGLGYYARARNLHRAARMVMDEYGGRFPGTVAELTRLPGVGRYSAGAIASIAFNRRAAVVDGNVARVLARVFAIELDMRGAAGRASAWAHAETLLPRSRCGDFNQALMELGATVCLPGAAARCTACPLRNRCAAYERGRVAELPIVASRVAVKAETHVVVAVERAGRWLFVRRPDSGLWGGLWALPSDVSGPRPPVEARRIAAALGLGKLVWRSGVFCDVTHQLTHKRIRFLGYIGRADSAGSRQRVERSGERCWVRLHEAERLGIATATCKVVDALTMATQSHPVRRT